MGGEVLGEMPNIDVILEEYRLWRGFPQVPS